MDIDGQPTFCPFFGKCDGLLVINPQDGSREFFRNELRTAEALCELILKSGAHGVVCGFIGVAEKRTLGACGIELRLGSCAGGLDELAAHYGDLPKA